MDRQAVSKIFPGLLSAYAQRLGFESVEEGKLTKVWRKEGKDLTLPKTVEIDDYSGTVVNAMFNLARLENLSVEKILTTLLLGRFDIVELPTVIDIDELSNAPIKVAGASADALEKLLTGVASSVALSKRSGAGQKSIRPQVTKFIESTTFGVFRNGHTSLAAFSPVSVTDAQIAEYGNVDVSASVPSPGFERDVMSQVPIALEAASTAVSVFASGKDNGAFEKSVDQGVNVMVLQSLQEIAKLPRRDASIRMFYSPLVVSKIPNRAVRVVGEDSIDVLTEGIKRLRQKTVPKVERLIGSIVKIDRDYEDQNGIVTMSAKLEGAKTSIKMRLLDDDYGVASEANRLRRRCSVIGTVDRGPKGVGWWLENARDVKLLDDAASEPEVDDRE